MQKQHSDAVAMNYRPGPARLADEAERDELMPDGTTVRVPLTLMDHQIRDAIRDGRASYGVTEWFAQDRTQPVSDAVVEQAWLDQGRALAQAYKNPAQRDAAPIVVSDGVDAREANWMAEGERLKNSWRIR
jgi:hypothetical protein